MIIKKNIFELIENLIFATAIIGIAGFLFFQHLDTSEIENSKKQIHTSSVSRIAN